MNLVFVPMMYVRGDLVAAQILENPGTRKGSLIATTDVEVLKIDYQDYTKIKKKFIKKKERVNIYSQLNT